MRDRICVDSPLCRGTSQGKYGSRIIGLVCTGRPSERYERWMKGVRENLCLWSVSGVARNETWHVNDRCFRDTKVCNPELCSS